MEVLSKDQFMTLVYKHQEKKKKKEIEAEIKKNREYFSFKIDQSQKYGVKYSKKKNIRR